MTKMPNKQKLFFLLLMVGSIFLSVQVTSAYAVTIVTPVVTKSVKKSAAPSIKIIQPVTKSGEVTTGAKDAAIKAQAVKPANASATPAKTPSQAVAQVVWVKGEMKAVGANNSSRPLQRRDVIYDLDTIVTGESGSGQIVFSDNTVSSLYPNTQLKIEKYKFTNGKDKSQDKFLVNVVKGGFRTISGAIAKSNPDNYQVNTPVATIGVRGTQWIVIVNPNNIYLKIEHGSIQIKTPLGTAVLDRAARDKLFASIDVKNPIPKVSSVSPTAEFNSAPPLAPATSTLSKDGTSTSSTGTNSTGAGASGSGGGGGSEGGSGGSSDDSSGAGASGGGDGGSGAGGGDSGSSDSGSGSGGGDSGSSDSGSGSGCGDSGSSDSISGGTSSSDGSSSVSTGGDGSGTDVGGYSSSQGSAPQSVDTGSSGSSGAPQGPVSGFCIQ